MRNKTPEKLEVLFLSFVGPNYSRSSTILNAESEVLRKKYMRLPKGVLGSINEMFKKRFEIRNSDCLVVMSPCHVLTPALKLIGRKPLILDAGWPLTDGHLSRGIRNKKILRLPLVYVIDFLSFCFADVVLVESKAQARRINKHFAIKKSKIKVQFTGINESSFILKSTESEVLLETRKRILELGLPLTVLFRGKINRESGFDRIISAARILKDSVIFIFLVGKNEVEVNLPANAIVVSQLSDNDMQEIYSLSDISIGQVSTHSRLGYTIPHKAFEAGFFSMPYITADSVGIREYLNEDSAFFLTKPSAESIVNAVSEMKSSAIRSIYAKKIKMNYSQNSSQKVLNEKFDQIVLDLCQVRGNKSL